MKEFMQNMDSGTTFLLKHIKLEKNDFQDIRAGQLTSRIIDAYFEIYERVRLQGIYIVKCFEHSEFEEIFNSNRENRRKIAQEMIDGYGIWKDHSLEVLVVPIFFKDHWIVAIADFKFSKIRVYDTSPEDHIHTSRPWEGSPYSNIFRVIILLVSDSGLIMDLNMSMTIIQSLRNGTSVVVQRKWAIPSRGKDEAIHKYQPSDDDKTKSGVYIMAIIFLLVNEKYDTIEEISEVLLDMLPLVCAKIMTAFMDHSIQVPPLEESETQEIYQRGYKKKSKVATKNLEFRGRSWMRR
ncbi:hypothetical protein K435DRAFT_811904 [Dendrothele bispora CBS 962.96]|uniref:Ubiquitin-like protease family profile domain-containing protein n=1 Tax=Dendrothele bispora (strain CBS 962.96) TaxID=1314807 RepID=A0A4S8KQV9_DENBC|nr:hypothetical protein K435DRAFT_812473 [Dendrothele bispora CBS 962.96]THU78040.1 hypothetical protein K435DRAFT_811904 [Dendrothele bispora CBS 962.96]